MSLKKSNKPVIYSVGHSAYTSGAFISLLQSFSIESVADIRRNPVYSQYPWFNKELLVKDLEKAGIDYIHLEALGGRRVTQESSPNNRLRSTSMRGYADHMVTPEFKSSMQVLEQMANRQETAFMCAEAVWWRCHRSLISDYLKARGWTVVHIMSIGKSEEHTYTSPARILKGRIVYSDSCKFE